MVIAFFKDISKLKWELFSDFSGHVYEDNKTNLTNMKY